MRWMLYCWMLVAAGCGYQTGTVEYADEPDPSGLPMYALAVTNQNFGDVTLYAVADGRRLRLGAVGGNSNRTFEFRWAYQTVAIEIDVLAGGRFITPQMLLTRGDELELIIPPSLDHQSGFRRIG